jgi:hypothetical protein
MKITKSYLKQVIKEELGRMEEGGVAIGSSDDDLAKMAYSDGAPNYATQSGMLKAVADHVIYKINKALEALQEGDSDRAEDILQDTMEYFDTKLTGFDPKRMGPRQEKK